MSEAERREAAADEAALATRNAEWEAFCKPTPKVDRDGITRITYAHKNCDIGRSN
jgi:hypothetical protein